MEELMNKVDNLIVKLDNTDLIKKIKESTEEIKNEKALLEDIRKYQATSDESIKKRIIQNNKYREYKHLETECNLIIMSINKKLKEIEPRKMCSKWKLSVVSIKEEY